MRSCESMKQAYCMYILLGRPQFIPHNTMKNESANLMSPDDMHYKDMFLVVLPE